MRQKKRKKKKKKRKTLDLAVVEQVEALLEPLVVDVV